MMKIGDWVFALLCVAGTAFTQASRVCDGEVRAAAVTAVEPAQAAAYAAEQWANPNYHARSVYCARVS